MKSRREQVVVLVSMSLLLAAGVALAANKRERSEAVYPKQIIPLTFSHELHFKNDVDECTACHEAGNKSMRATDRLLPAHPECESCHDIEAAAAGKKVDPKAACEDCHKGFDKSVMKEPPKALFPNANLVMNHKVHKEKGVECVTCHFSSVTDTMREVDLATRFQLPKMDTCLTCHNGKTAPSSCSTCHVIDSAGRLAQQFTSGTLRPMQGDPFGLDHGPRFEFNHGTRAKLDRQICMECHTEGSCAQCHDGLQKPLSIHPNDFIVIHPVQARMDQTRCEACHRFQSFCAACHDRSGIGLEADPTLRARNVRVHPDYTSWVVDSSSPNFHAVAASRDIKTCISCHREETCLRCHSTTKVNNGRGSMPHGNEFKGGVGCQTMLARNNRGCFKCHLPTDLVAPKCN